MNTQKMALSFLLLTSAMPLTASIDDIFTSMMEEMDRFHHQMIEEMKSIHQTFITQPVPHNKNSTAISLAEKNGAIEITFSHFDIPDENFKATMNSKNNTITIETAIGTILVQARNRFIAVQYALDKKEATDHTIARAASCQRIGQTVSAKMRLEDVQINYNKTEKTLTLTIPLEDEKEELKKATKEIPIHVK